MSRSDSRDTSPKRMQTAKSKKLYITGLSESIQADNVRKVFEEFGEITDVHVKNKDTFSFAFVEYSSIHEAQKAVRSLNKEVIDGRELRVAFARPRQPRNQGGEQRTYYDKPKEGGYRQNLGERRNRSRSRDNNNSGAPAKRDNGGYGGDRPKGCFNCGQNGHFSRECPQPKQMRKDFNSGGDRGGGDRGGARGGYGNRDGDRNGGDRNGGDRYAYNKPDRNGNELQSNTDNYIKVPKSADKDMDY